MVNLRPEYGLVKQRRNNLTAGGLTVKFSLGSTTGGQGTFSAVTDNHNGTYTVTFTGTTAGSNTIKATIGGNAVTSTAPTITITAAANRSKWWAMSGAIWPPPWPAIRSATAGYRAVDRRHRVCCPLVRTALSRRGR